jgi:hypothetical protein
MIGNGGPEATAFQRVGARGPGPQRLQVVSGRCSRVPGIVDRSRQALSATRSAPASNLRLSLTGTFTGCQAHSQRVTDELHQRRTYVAVHDMLRRLAEANDFDFVIVDVGPSAGALTRSFFLSCDRFLIPTVPDRFNYQAVGSLSRILSKWITEHSAVVENFRAMDLNISAGAPVLHGVVMQRYQRYANAPKRSFRVWMERISERARDLLLPTLTETSRGAGVADGLSTEPTIASIPDFSGLGPIMLAVGRPVWRIEKEEADFRGVVWEQTVDRLDDFRETHYQLAQSLVDAVE